MNGTLPAGAFETRCYRAELGERYYQPVQHGFELFSSFRGRPPILAFESMPGSSHLRDSTLPLKSLPAERGAAWWPWGQNQRMRDTEMESLVQYNKEELANQSFLTGMSLPSLGVFKQRPAGCTWSWSTRRVNSYGCEHPFPPASLHLRRTAAASHGLHKNPSAGQLRTAAKSRLSLPSLLWVFSLPMVSGRANPSVGGAVGPRLMLCRPVQSLPPF